MKYIKKFSTETQYNDFLEGDDYVVPHVVMFQDSSNESIVKIKGYIPKIENKCTVSIHRFGMVILTFAFPIESDIRLIWKYSDNSSTVIDLEKGFQSGKFPEPLYDDEQNLQQYIKSITPSEDDVYIYTW